MPVGNTARQAGGSCYDRMKMAAVMGFGIGLTAGMLFGGIAALRWGLGMCVLNSIGFPANMVCPLFGPQASHVLKVQHSTAYRCPMKLMNTQLCAQYEN